MVPLGEDVILQLQYLIRVHVYTFSLFKEGGKKKKQTQRDQNKPKPSKVPLLIKVFILFSLVIFFIDLDRLVGFTGDQP